MNGEDLIEMMEKCENEWVAKGMCYEECSLNEYWNTYISRYNGYPKPKHKVTDKRKRQRQINAPIDNKITKLEPTIDDSNITGLEPVIE